MFLNFFTWLKIGQKAKMIVHTNTVQNTNIFVFKGFSNFFLLKGMHSGDFLRVLAKTQFVQNGKTQFKKAKTQFENWMSPIYCKFYTIQWNLKAPNEQNSIEIVQDVKDLS